MRKYPIIIFSMVLLLLNGCGLMYKANVKTHIETVPVEEYQQFDISIIEGKTTKQEILDTLGMPESIGSSLHYDFSKNKICNLKLTQSDGTKMNVVLKPKQKMHDLTIYFNNDSTSIVSSVHIF